MENPQVFTQASEHQKRYHRGLIFGLVNGPIVYSVYFLIVYFLVEGGCKSGLVRTQLFGFDSVSAWIVLLTLIATAATGLGGVVAWRGLRQSRHNIRRTDAYSHFMGVAGLGLNGLFALLILLTGLPVLLLEMCTWI
jgi:hypothetical protein